MIGFFYALFWHGNNKAIRNNTLRFFIFLGMCFGISDEEHKKSFL
ncbi:hypothetical protein FEM21_12480 [Flavobacterium seoulense]|uniref:Uncharacterized protein n=1 Tax=Flavobacterium seoulense TaxID=1492738 RepID=A0A066WP46_9FLAO|nr:hypothetical protein FEM21_12480 [Flavobacterium seoulense]